MENSRQRISVNLAGKKRVSEGRFAAGAVELNPFTVRTCSWSACCWEISNASSAVSKSGAGLEAATQRAKQKIRDNSIQAPRITNNTVVILNICSSSQRAAGKPTQFLENWLGIALCRNGRCPNPLRRRPIHRLSAIVSLLIAGRVSLIDILAFPNAIQRVRKRRRV